MLLFMILLSIPVDREKEKHKHTKHIVKGNFFIYLLFLWIVKFNGSSGNSMDEAMDKHEGYWSLNWAGYSQ